jgi:hypothetical protein
MDSGSLFSWYLKLHLRGQSLAVGGTTSMSGKTYAGQGIKGR